MRLRLRGGETHGDYDRFVLAGVDRRLLAVEFII